MISRHQNRAKNGGYNFAPVLNSDSLLNDYKLGERVKLNVKIQNQLYRKEDTGWSIYLVEMDDWRFKINGVFVMPLMFDNYYTVSGIVCEYNDERSLKVDSYKYYQPEDERSIIEVLSTIEELNVSAQSVYHQYGENILRDIIEHPRKVARALGYKEAKVKEWGRYLSRQNKSEETFEMLKNYGLSDTTAKDLWERFGEEILEIIKVNPYKLIDEVPSLTFKKCDAKALENGYQFDGIDRVSYGMLSVLKSAAAMHGHCYLPEAEFVEEAHRQLNISLNAREAMKLLSGGSKGVVSVTKNNVKGKVDMAQLREAMSTWQSSDKKEAFVYNITELSDSAFRAGLGNMLTASRIIENIAEDGKKVYMLGYYDRAEHIVANAAHNLSKAEYEKFSCTEEELGNVCQEEGITLEAKQYQAALRFSRAKGGMFILNGAAGCGKTFVLNIILKVLERLYGEERFSAKILAPTGKAAQVAQKATGLDAATIHRELGLVNGSQSEPKKNEMIKEDCLIIDEFSMVDIVLAAQLFERITPYTKVIILGDTQQLPSIGAGSVLKDLIESHVVETVTLDVVKRQTEGSGILQNANQILAGQPIENIVNNREGDAYVIEKEGAVEARKTMLRLVKKAVEAQGLFNVQVLCPQKKTQVGTEVMNYCIQQVLNPDRAGEMIIPAKKVKIVNCEGAEFERTLNFKKGDKVIHTKNNYQMQWYKYSPVLGFTQNFERMGIINGEIGEIVDIVADPDKKSKNKITVKYDDGYVVYEKDFSELDHAYAITIHKAQGSQWPTVIAPSCRCNRIMLNRKLIYTLYTRAQTLSFVVGERDAMNYAVENNENAVRYTMLQERLKALQSVY